MKNFFKPEDFPGFLFQSRKYAAGQANKKLNALIETWPVVYGNGTQMDVVSEPSNVDTHKARLAFVEEIKKEPCKHSPSWAKLKSLLSTDEHDNKHELVELVCKHCGIKLHATFEEKK